MNELLQQLNDCFTNVTNTDGETGEQVDIQAAIKIIKQILEQMNA